MIVKIVRPHIAVAKLRLNAKYHLRLYAMIEQHIVNNTATIYIIESLVSIGTSVDC